MAFSQGPQIHWDTYHVRIVESTIMNITYGWITGVALGVEFVGKDEYEYEYDEGDYDDEEENVNTIILDLLIIRILIQWE